VAERGPVAGLTVDLESLRRNPTVRAVAVVLLAGVVWAYLALTAERHGFFDLRVYYGAINYWQHTGGQIYDFLLPRTEYGFTYPPFGAVTMLPMALVGWHLAIVISIALSLGAVWILIRLLLDPIIKRQGWARWFAIGLAAVALAAFEPVHETFAFGQVNLLLVAVVALDVLLLVRTGNKFGGVGIGLATAVKLTPGIFIVYLLVTRRWRAAAVATGAFTAATWLAATLAPDPSRVFWTDALWDTSRVGRAAFVSNQSLNGLVARIFAPSEPSKLVLLAVVLAMFAVWAVRVRRAVAARDEVAAFALTGLIGCLVSPITWVHHLVWVLPAMAVMVDHALDPAADPRRRRRMLLVTIGQYGGLGLLGSNAYVLVMIGLLLGLPIRERVDASPSRLAAGHPTAADVPDLVELDRRVTAAFDAKDAGLPVEAESMATGVPLSSVPGGQGVHQ
jgi:alpha-1,2-mannosyltransferase